MERATLDIYPSTGEEPRVSALLEKGSAWETMLMQKDEIRLRFTTSEPVTFHRGDYAYVPGAGVFEVMDESQRPDFDTRSGAFVYNIKLHARYRKFADRVHRFSSDVSSPETKWSLTDTCESHGKRIIASMNALADKDDAFRPWEQNSEGEHRWELEVDGVIVDTTKCLTITYDGTKILDAIDEIAREFECEWWFAGATLHFGKCRHSDAVSVRAGVELGKVSRSDSSESKATRIYFQGSTRNIPSTYRHTLLLHADRTISNPSGKFAFRDSLRDIPNEAFPDSTRRYMYIDSEAEPMDDITSPLWQEISTTFKTQGKLTRYMALLGNDTLRMTKDGIKPGNYRIDLTGYTFKLRDIKQSGSNQNDSSGVTARLHVEINSYQGRLNGGKLLESIDNCGVWVQANSYYHSVDLWGTKTYFNLAQAATYIEVAVWIEVKAPKEGFCYLEFAIDSKTDNLKQMQEERKILTASVPGKFSIEGLTIQFRDQKGEPQGDPITGVAFNPDMSSRADERWFVVPETAMAILPAIGSGEHRCFTIEQGVDLPFVPASMWTSNAVLRNGSEATVDGVAERRLLLPLKDEEGNPLHGYLDTRSGLTEAEVIEEVKTIDDCYPGTETMITELEQTEQTYTDTYELSDGSEEKRTWKAWMFKCPIFDNKPFSKRYLLDNEKLQVTFQDSENPGGGRLNGMTFELLPRDDGFMEIVRDGTSLLPNEMVRPEIGDKMILTGFDVRMFSDADNDLIAQAEDKLLAKARAIVSDINTDASTYEGEILCDIAREQIPGFDSMMLTPGHRVALTVPEYGLDRFITRVLGFSIPLDIEFDNPTFTFGEQTAYSRLASLEDKLNGIDRKTHARAGGEAMGSVPYDPDCYILLERSFVQLAKDARPTEDTPLDIRAYMVVNGKRMKAEWSWTSETEGITAEFIKDALDPNASILRIIALPEDYSSITIKVTGIAENATAETGLQIVTGSSEGGHLHTMTVSHPVVCFGHTNEGGRFARPVKVTIRTLVSTSTGAEPTQDGFLMMRTDQDAIWASVPREQGVAEIMILDILDATPMARRVDLAFYCPTYDERNIVAESSIILMETLMVSVDRGQWEAGAQYYAGDLNPETDFVEISYVWYMGCKYRCLVTGTTDPPLWDSPDWDMVEGDPALHLEWVGSEDTVYADDPKITLSLRATIFNQDVTEHARTRWDWHRESIHGTAPNTLEDAAWNDNHQNQGEHELTLVEADMNYHAGQHPDKLVYTATATIRDAQGQVFKTQAYKVEF